MNHPQRHSFLGAVLIVAAVSPSSPAAEALLERPPLSNYRIEIGIESRDGPPRRCAIVTTGGTVEGSWVAPGVDLGPTEAPSILKFTAEVEVVGTDRLWLRKVRVGQQVPIVTGFRTAMPATTRTFGGDRRGGERPAGQFERPGRSERRPATEEAEVPETQPGDEPPPPPVAGPALRSAPAPFAQTRSVTYQDVGTISSVVLVIGKPIVVSEDDTQRVILTAKRVDE
jgi:hypothetical protein